MWREIAKVLRSAIFAKDEQFRIVVYDLKVSNITSVALNGCENLQFENYPHSHGRLFLVLNLPPPPPITTTITGNANFLQYKIIVYYFGIYPFFIFLSEILNSSVGWGKGV